MEPASKRICLTEHHKTLNESTKDALKIRCILPEKYIKPIKTTKVYVSLIKDMKIVSKLIDHLTRCLPIGDLQHLKRVRKNQIIICSENSIKTFEDSDVIIDEQKQAVLDFILKQGLDEMTASDLCANLSISEVASIQPKLRWQYNEMNKLWPCKFHPNKYLESLFANSNFADKERLFHQKIAYAVKLLSEKEISKEAGICIDPRTNSIVATASDQLEVNPLLDCPMVLMDMVARTQNGGVWEYPCYEFMENTDKLNFSGIPRNHYEILNGSFVDFNFGAEKVDHERKIINSNAHEHDNLTKYGPYLCTGYDVYLSKEPCLMSAMALIHSRVKRVFYMKVNEKGALGSLLKLHTVKDLNHHFEVYRIFEEDANRC